MIKQDRADRAIGAQVIFVGRVVAVPRHHVERALPNFGSVKLTTPLDRDGRGHFAVLKGGNRCLEITRVRHAVGADRAAGWQVEFLAVVLTDKAARGAVQHLDTVDQTARDDRDFLGFKVDDPQFGRETQAAFLWHHKHLAVRREEIGVLHGLGHQIDVAGHAHLRVHVTRRRHSAHPRQPCERLIRMRDRVPAVLTQRGHIKVDIRSGAEMRQVDFFIAVAVFDRRADAITPRAFGAHIGECRAGKLLAI